jgi:hypothetical protein
MKVEVVSSSDFWTVTMRWDLIFTCCTTLEQSIISSGWTFVSFQRRQHARAPTCLHRLWASLAIWSPTTTLPTVWSIALVRALLQWLCGRRSSRQSSSLPVALVLFCSTVPSFITGFHSLYALVLKWACFQFVWGTSLLLLAIKNLQMCSRSILSFYRRYDLSTCLVLLQNVRCREKQLI